MTTRRYLVLDYETRSECDLRASGSWEYSKHHSTEILCVAWKLGTRDELRSQPVKTWSPFSPSPYGELTRALGDSSVTIVAHNALFEQVITRNVLSRIVNREWLKSIPVSRWLCTASLARAVALPGNLEGAALALKLPVEKDMDGRRLMLKMSKPRKATKTNAAKWHESPEDLARLIAYCAKDVEVEAELFLTLPPLNDTERKVWELDQKINLRGFTVDRPLVTKALALIAEETEGLRRETDELSFGGLESTNQRAAVLKWLEAEGVYLPDLRAKTVLDAIKEGLVTGAALRMLEIRQAVSKTSTAKYEAFDARSRSDGRCRDNLIYHTASTGRWGGAGVQPQNLPRPSIENTDLAADVVLGSDLELLRLVYGNPMETLASVLRSVIVASPGKELFVADYAAIEARVLFWFARHDAGLRAFREGRDLYKEMAAVIYGVPVESVTKFQRQVGKGAVLGCGYSMGGKKFHATCLNQGIEISPEIADAAVKAYRSTHHPVVKFWSNTERAAVAAVLNPGKRYTVNRVTWFVSGKFLFAELPSKRRLAYYGPRVAYEKTPWDEKRPVLYHYGVDIARKFTEAKTYGGRLVENLIQGAARDFMAQAMLDVERAGYEVILTVHDELVAERETGRGSQEEFERIMAAPPAWALDCPIKVEGYVAKRYRK